MNKKDKINLCVYYEELQEALIKVTNALVFRPKTQIEYDEIYDKVHDRISKANDIVYKMFDDFKLEETYFKEFCDEHLGCYSYPNCDDAPLGCCIIHGKDAEPYGHR